MILEKSTDFENLISDGLVIVDFFATWCGPCKMLAPMLEQLLEINPDLKLVKVDVDQFQPIAVKYGVYAMPTLMFFKNGEKVLTSVGFKPLNQLQELVDSVK